MRLTAGLLAIGMIACVARPETTNDSAAASVAAGGDADVPAVGTGIPAGFTAVTDDTSAKLTSIRYAPSSGRWDVTTGPAHIVYADKDSASGAYTASVTFAQLEAPRHPEAYGLFVGGSGLGTPQKAYTYFIVRGTGEFAVKTRDGARTSDVVKWTANKAVAKQDSSGKASYRMAIRAATDSVRFLINDVQVAAVKAGAVPAAGIAGLRINHNLHLLTAPVTITR